jgi:hypothetical protein
MGTGTSLDAIFPRFSHVGSEPVPILSQALKSTVSEVARPDPLKRGATCQGMPRIAGYTPTPRYSKTGETTHPPHPALGGWQCPRPAATLGVAPTAPPPADCRPTSLLGGSSTSHAHRVPLSWVQPAAGSRRRLCGEASGLSRMWNRGRHPVRSSIRAATGCRRLRPRSRRASGPRLRRSRVPRACPTPPFVFRLSPRRNRSGHPQLPRSSHPGNDLLLSAFRDCGDRLCGASQRQIGRRRLRRRPLLLQ